MPITVSEALRKVKEHNFGQDDARSLITYSETAGLHPHEHIMGWTADDSHIDGTERDRSRIKFAGGGIGLDTSSVFTTTAEALTALVYSLNTNAGEVALTKLTGQPSPSRVTIHSRSGAYGCSYGMGERWNNFMTDEIMVEKGKSQWVVTVFQKEAGGNLAIVTHYPNAGGGRLTPAHQRDLVEFVGGTASCESSESNRGMAIRGFRWVAGNAYWLKHKTTG